MIAFVAGLVWVALFAWLLSRAVRQFRAYEVIPSPPAVRGDGEEPSLTVVVPARNEAHNIARCLRGLLSQDFPRDRLRVVVVDDGSTDGTEAIARQVAGRDPSVTILRAGELPAGWGGKSRACWRGVQGVEAEWLCFIDADTVASPGLLRTAVAFAKGREIDMLSLEPFQELVSFWERLIITSGLFMVSAAVDLRTINDADAEEARADGQFILIRSDVYDRIGGHEAVRSEISEDSALAREVKRAGCRPYLMGGADLVRVRMYTGFRDLWEGLAKNAVDVVDTTAAAWTAALGGVAVGWLSVLLPLWAGLTAASTGNGLDALGFVLALLGSLAFFATHLAGTRYFRIPFGYGLLFPVGYTLVAAITLRSIWMRRHGKIRWKGRVYPSPQES